MSEAPDTSLPRPYIERNRRNLPTHAAVDWLKDGWRDFMIQPIPSLAYGVAVFAVLGILGFEIVRRVEIYTTPWRGQAQGG